MAQSIHLFPVACLFNKSLQYPDQRILIPVSFPPDSFQFYFFHLTLSSIWKLFWLRTLGRDLTFFSVKSPFSHSNGCGFYLEADGESPKKAKHGRDVMSFTVRESCLWHLEVHTWFLAVAVLKLLPHSLWPPIVLEDCLWLSGIKEDPRTLQEIIREMHQAFFFSSALARSWLETFDVCKRPPRLALNIHSSAFFELRPDIELALQKAMCLLHISSVPSRTASLH